MEINPTDKTFVNEKSQIKKNKIPAQEQIEQVSKEYPDSLSMRAYANIKTKGKTVSKQEALDFIHSTGCQFEQRCEQFLEAMTDSDGLIKQSTFDWAKKGYENTGNLYFAMNLIESSKENGKINRNVLKLFEPAMDEMKNMRGYSVSNMFNMPRYFKDKDGKFNNELLEMLKPAVEEKPKLLINFPDRLMNPFITKEREFDLDAISYYKDQQSSGRQFKDITNDIYAGRNQEGKFSLEKLGIYKELEPHLQKWQISKAQSLIDKANDKKEFLELAKTMNKDEELTTIFETIEDIISTEGDKTGLNYDKKSVEFVRDLKHSTCATQNEIEQILKTVNKPVSEYSPEELKTIKDTFLYVHDEKHLGSILDAAFYKAGDRKGQFSFENLKKYLDIYKGSFNSVDEVKYISNLLSLETDDKALDTIHKLYGLEWTETTRFGERRNRLNRSSLHTLFDLSTSNFSGAPKNKFYTQVLDNFNKLMTMRLPMSSKEAFENFMVFGEFDIIEKLEKVRLDEIGINTGQLSHGKFKSATEDELFAFKGYMLDFLKDKDLKNMSVDLNTNIADVVEITNSHCNEKDKILYNIVKKRPLAEMKEKRGVYFIEKEQKDFEKNIVTNQVFRLKTEHYSEYEELYHQTVYKYDKNWNLKYTERMEPSEIEGVFNVTKTYPDGKIENVVKAQKLPNGNELVEKNLVSSQGVKTIYRYENDVQGNRIMDYKIIDTDGKVLMDQSSTFEVIDENHFVTSRNNKKFDVKFEGDFVHVKDMQTGKIAEIDLVNFTNSTQKELIPILKKIPGDELFEMKEFNLKELSVNNELANAAFIPKTESIGLSTPYLDEGVLLHEWGHGKDELAFKEIEEKIANNPKINELYEDAKKAVRETMSEAELEHFSYFGADYHYLGSKKIKEGIAETNILLDLLPRHKVNSARAHYWMQEFAKVIAEAAKLLH